MPLKAFVSKCGGGEGGTGHIMIPFFFFKEACVYTQSQKKYRNVLSNTTVTSHVWMLSTCNVGSPNQEIFLSVKDKPNFKHLVQRM